MGSVPISFEVETRRKSLDTDVKRALHLKCQVCLTWRNSMDANNKRYLKEFLGSMAAYSAMVPFSIWMLRGHEHTPLGYGIAFPPIIPSAFAMWAFLRL